MFISGSAAGDVVMGALILLVTVTLASAGFLFPPGMALVWSALCGYVFAALHLRSGLTDDRAALRRLYHPGFAGDPGE